MIVVVDPAKVIEAEVAGQRCRLGADAFHQAAVAAYAVNIVVEDGKVRLVVPHSEPALRDRHTDAGRNTLSERAGGGLDAGYQMVFRMSWRVTPKLAKAADIVEGNSRPSQ